MEKLHLKYCTKSHFMKRSAEVPPLSDILSSQIIWAWGRERAGTDNNRSEVGGKGGFVQNAL